MRALLGAVPVVLAIGLVLGSACVHRLRGERIPPAAGATLVDGVPIEVFADDACGAGSLSAILTHHGLPASPQSLAAELPADRRGRVLSIDLMLAARRHGLDAKWIVGDAAALERELRDGAPPILLLLLMDAPGRRRDMSHYAVATGMDASGERVRLLLGDGEERWVPMRRLERAWRPTDRAMLVARRPGAR